MRFQTPWINKLSEGLKVADIETMRSIITTLRQRLMGEADEEERI